MSSAILIPWNHNAGWGSHFLLAIFMCYESEKKGYIPNFIEMKLPSYSSHFSDVVCQKKNSTDTEIHFPNKPWVDIFVDTIPHTKMSISIRDKLRPICKTFITKFNKDITLFVEDIIKNYPIKESVCVYFRGTDKKQEYPRPDMDKYITFLSSYPSTTPFLVQSDEQSFIDLMKEKFPTQAWSLPFITTGNDGKPLHYHANYNDLKEIISLTLIMASTSYFIGNVSNITHVVVLIRDDDNYEYIF